MTHTQNTRSFLFFLLGLLLLATGGAVRAEDAAITAAKSFLVAVSTLHLQTAQALMPDSAAALFGPCDFAGVPSISDPAVRGNQGVARWHGKTLDPKVADSGYILFRKDGSGAWRVRQICHHDNMGDLTRTKMMMSRESGADKAAKSGLCGLGQEYCRAWLNHDYGTMRALWYDWPHKQLTDDRPVKLHVVSAAMRTTYFHEPCVHLRVDVQLPVLSIFSKEYQCDLVVINQNGQWKVRGSRIEFYD